MNTCTDPRHLARLRVELMGDDGSGYRFRQTAFTRDVSMRGARIADAPSFLSATSVIELKYRGRKSRFRVVWVGIATNDIGLRSLDPERCLWGTPLPGKRIHSTPPAPPPVIAKRPEPVPVTIRPEVTAQKKEPVGFFCKDARCRQRHVFHRIPDDVVVWDIWPQKLACPVTGQRYEYSHGEVRSAGYV